MLGWQWNAVHLVREDRVTREQLGERHAPLVRLRLPTIDTAIEPGEENLDRVVLHARVSQHAGDGDPAPAGGADRLQQPRLAHDVRLDVRATVPGALHRHGDLPRRPSAQLVERERELPVDQAADLETPRRRVDLGDVEVREEVVEPDGCDLPAERLERDPVVPRRKLELLQADPGASLTGQP